MTDQDSSDPRVRESAEEARAGETSGRMRFVLLISLVLIVVIFAAIVWGPLLFHK
jgi:hypothetical protein